MLQGMIFIENHPLYFFKLFQTLNILSHQMLRTTKVTDQRNDVYPFIVCILILRMSAGATFNQMVNLKTQINFVHYN